MKLFNFFLVIVVAVAHCSGTCTRSQPSKEEIRRDLLTRFGEFVGSTMEETPVLSNYLWEITLNNCEFNCLKRAFNMTDEVQFQIFYNSQGSALKTQFIKELLAALGQTNVDPQVFAAISSTVSFEKCDSGVTARFITKNAPSHGGSITTEQAINVVMNSTILNGFMDKYENQLVAAFHCIGNQIDDVEYDY